MDKTPLFCCLLSGLIPVSASAAPSSPPFPTQAEVAADASLYSPAMYLRRSDILLAVIIYKTVETDQEITYYARVVQSLRGDIPVEALIQWSWAAHKHSAVSFSKPEPGSSPKTELYSGNYMYYTLASSKEVKKLPDTPESFAPADSIPGLDSYDLGDDSHLLPDGGERSGPSYKETPSYEPARITRQKPRLPASGPLPANNVLLFFLSVFPAGPSLLPGHVSSPRPVPFRKQAFFCISAFPSLSRTGGKIHEKTGSRFREPGLKKGGSVRRPD